MSIAEPKITAVLLHDATVAALAGTRVHPAPLPRGCALPAISYARISGGQVYSLAGYSGLENPRIQVDCWAETYDAAKALATAVRAAMDRATTFNALVIGDRDQFSDTGQKPHSVTLDFSVWNLE
ncbi:MAG: DUF3168 domain-containing protein [Desulfovibrionaceae bacterium]